MLNPSTRIRSAGQWMLVALFALFGVWSFEQSWTMIEANAAWQAILMPTLALVGAISLTARALRDARRRPIPVRLVSRRQR